MPTYELRIDGMHCGGCEDRVESGLAQVEVVRSAEADHEASRAEVRVVAGDEDEEAVRAAVEDLGYEVVALEST
jgi:copper chaperone